MFDKVLEDIEGQFADSSWTSTGIATYPANYQGKKSDGNEYCIVSVLPSSSQQLAYGGVKTTKGLIAISIFVKAGQGQRRLMEICDSLDNLLQFEKFNNGTELGTSYFNVEGLDPINSSLFMGTYFIPFTLYGE
jgi:hypothetical protein